MRIVLAATLGFLATMMWVQIPGTFFSSTGFYPQWAGMRAHLSDVSDSAVLRIREHLYFYDLQMGFVVSYQGLLYVLWCHLWSGYRGLDVTAKNHGLSMWYFKPYEAGDPKVRNPTKWKFDVLESSPFPENIVQDSVNKLRAHAVEIRQEFEQKMAPSMNPHPDSKTEMEGGSWEWNFLYGTTGKNHEVCKRVPKTHAVVTSLPVTYNYGFVFFSRIKPGTHIKKHTGCTNLRIRLHLGVQIPTEEGGYVPTIRVGTEHHPWKQDDVLVFDDAFEHEITYEGKQERAVFIVDVWHPQVTLKERELLSYEGFGPFGTKGTNFRSLD
jgi:hypothetical protein